MAMTVIRRRRRRYDVCFYAPRIGPLLVPDEVTPAGGAETQVLLIASALAARGLRVCLIAFAMPGIALPTAVDGITVAVRPPYRTRSRFGKVRETISIFRAVGVHDAEVVVTRMEAPEVGIAATAARLLRRRFVYSSASLSDFEPNPYAERRDANPSRALDFSRLSRKPLDWRLFRYGLRLADEIVVQTEEQVRLCQQHLGRSPILIRSIAEVVPPRAAAPEAFLWIGRVVRMKRPEAYLELARTVSEAQFFMVAVASDQPEHAELFREVERAAATIPNLTLLPPRPRNELMAVLDRTVAVVSTSDFEGMPNTFLEGWARGIPALALSHDPDGIIERYGLGACAAGSAEVLAEHARRFWQTRKDFGELATRCRSYVEEHHSPHSVGARWEQVLRAGAGAHSSRRRSTSSS